MTDAQYLFDLASKQYNEVADSIERHFETVADHLREYLPRSVQPPPPPPRRIIPLTYWHRVERWVTNNRALTAGIAAFVGTGAALLILQRRSYNTRRRAKRASNNARTEVIVLAGSPTSPTTTALALDLERRGFIVYIITSSAEEEQHVRNHSRADVMPLTLDLVYPEAAHEQLDKFHRLLSRHHFAIEGQAGHRLSLSGIILVPDTTSEVGPVSSLSADSWSTALNAKVLNTILTTQHLLPLVTEFNSRILLLTPSIVPSLRPPHHAIQSTVSGALEAFAGSLASELRLQDIGFCHLKLGHLDIPGSRQRGEDGARRVKGTPVRRLHDAVFDALQTRHPSRTWHVGKGSLVYDVIGGWLPLGVVGWMMGLRRPQAGSQAGSHDQLVLETSESSAQWEKVEDMSSQ